MESNDHGTEIDGLPVDRDYDFSTEIPDIDQLPTYYSADGEDDMIMASIENRHRSDQLPRFLIGGPTGSGKTHLARVLAARLEAPMFTIQGGHGNRESDLLGSLSLIDGDTVWTDGVLTKALIASRDGPVILLLDEVNRTPPAAKGFLYSALDNRAEVVINARGGEIIEGDADNLITIGTINEGAGYFTEELDLAERRRLMSGGRFDVDYLGLTNPDQETALLQERTGLSEKDAMRFVSIANEIRNTANDPSSDIPMGVPTGVLLSWVDATITYAEHGIDSPAETAGEVTLADPFFSDNESAHAAVVSAIHGGPTARLEL